VLVSSVSYWYYSLYVLLALIAIELLALVASELLALVASELF